MIIFIVSFIILIYKNYSIIVIPFEISELNYSAQNYSINNLINDIFYRDLYTTLYIGTPPKEVLILIRPDNQTLFLNKNDCERKKLENFDKKKSLYKNKTFNHRESSTFNEISKINNDFYGKDFNYLVSDSISFYDISCLNNTLKCQLKIIFEEFQFNVEKEYNNKLCGRLGVGFSKTTQLHIINQLKRKNLSKNY